MRQQSGNIYWEVDAMYITSTSLTRIEIDATQAYYQRFQQATIGAVVQKGGIICSALAAVFGAVWIQCCDCLGDKEALSLITM